MLLLIGITISCSSVEDDVSEPGRLKEITDQLEKARDASLIIKEVIELTDEGGWKIIFTDGTTISLEESISITEDQEANVIRITMPDGISFIFDLEKIDFEITVLEQRVSLTPTSVESFQFQVNPSDLLFNYDVESEDVAIRLNLLEATRSSSSSDIVTPEYYELSKIEPALNNQGKTEAGHYIAYVKDNRLLEIYLDKVELVLTIKDKNNKSVEYFSQQFEITSGELPVIYLTTPDNQPITSKESWTSDCIMELKTLSGEADLQLSKVSLRGRGNSTWTYPKKPFAIKLDKKTEVLGMPEHKRWILLANWMDKTLLRNSIAFEVSRKTGLAYTPRGTFVEVVLNGEFIGNYYLCEHIKIDVGRVNIPKMKASHLKEPEITGGYLLELDSYFDEINKFRTARKNLPVNIKEPDEDVLTGEQKNYIQSYFNKIEDILYGSGLGSYADYIDMNSFIDWWLVHELTLNGEPNHPKSSYMHKDRNGKLVAGPVWDFDWGTFRPYSGGFINANTIWYDKLFQDAAFKATVKERWNILKPEFQSVLTFIDEQAAYIRQSALINGTKWPITQNVNGDEHLSFDDAVTRLRDAYEQRIITIDRLINQ